MESPQYLEGARQQDLYGQHLRQQPVTPVFNSRKIDFNVWDSFNNAFFATQDAERRRRKGLEEQQAMQRFGQQPYLPGYEGVQGAEMPGWLGRLYPANPDLAIKIGERVAAPFAQQREIEKAGQIEAAKRQANMDSGLEFVRSLGDAESVNREERRQPSYIRSRAA